MVVFKDFFVFCKFVKSLNSTVIVMVPTKDGRMILRILDL